jgi:hypothetical protein
LNDSDSEVLFSGNMDGGNAMCGTIGDSPLYLLVTVGVEERDDNDQKDFVVQGARVVRLRRQPEPATQGCEDNPAGG